jgi:hypothetical protein
MGSPRESTLDCWVCVSTLGTGIECKVLRFMGVGSVDAGFRREPLGSRAESLGPSPGKRCARCALGAGHWDGSPGSCE